MAKGAEWDANDHYAKADYYKKLQDLYTQDLVDLSLKQAQK
jgi:hypothetical protein